MEYLKRKILFLFFFSFFLTTQNLFGTFSNIYTEFLNQENYQLYYCFLTPLLFLLLPFFYIFCPYIFEVSIFDPNFRFVFSIIPRA